MKKGVRSEVPIEIPPFLVVAVVSAIVVEFADVGIPPLSVVVAISAVVVSVDVEIPPLSVVFAISIGVVEFINVDSLVELETV